MKANHKKPANAVSALFGRHSRSYGFRPHGIFGLFKIGQERATVGTHKFTVRKVRLLALSASAPETTTRN